MQDSYVLGREVSARGSSAPVVAEGSLASEALYCLRLAAENDGIEIALAVGRADRGWASTGARFSIPTDHEPLIDYLTSLMIGQFAVLAFRGRVPTLKTSTHVVETILPVYAFQESGLEITVFLLEIPANAHMSATGQTPAGLKLTKQLEMRPPPLPSRRD